MAFGRQDIRKCVTCGKGIASAGPVFYRLRVEQMVLDRRAIESEAGLEQMMGGNVAIAAALSPNTDFAKTFREAEVLLCGACAIEPTCVAVLLDTDEGDAA